MEPLVDITNRITVESILQLLPQLKDAELKQIADRIAITLGKNIIRLSDDARYVQNDPFVSALLEQLRARFGNDATLNSFAVTKTKAWERYLKTIRTGVESWGARNTVGFSKLEQTAFWKICARAQLDYVGTFTETNIRTALWYAGDIAEAFDRAFPGYLEAGLVRLLVRKHQR